MQSYLLPTIQIQEMSKKIQNMANERDQAIDFGDYSYAETLTQKLEELIATQDALSIEQYGDILQ